MRTAAIIRAALNARWDEHPSTRIKKTTAALTALEQMERDTARMRDALTELKGMLALMPGEHINACTLLLDSVIDAAMGDAAPPVSSVPQVESIAVRMRTAAALAGLTPAQWTDAYSTLTPEQLRVVFAPGSDTGTQDDQMDPAKVAAIRKMLGQDAAAFVKIFNGLTGEQIATAMESMPTDALEWGVRFEAAAHHEKPGDTGDKGEARVSVKVFAMNDCDWWAAETLDEAKTAYLDQTGMTEADGPFDDPYELDAKAMDRLRFSDNDGAVRTFREQLERMLASGQKFPAFFASTEY